jgi:hypothetical protein
MGSLQPPARATVPLLVRTAIWFPVRVPRQYPPVVLPPRVHLPTPMIHSTLIAASLLTRRKTKSQLVEDPRIDLLPEGAPGPRRFKIKAADTASRRTLASRLLESRYQWRGYKAVGLPTDTAVHRFTLVAVEYDITIGTITVALDGSEGGLAADDAFGPELAALRAEGHTLCEFTKLAIDPSIGSKRVLAALFHVAYIVAHRLRGYDTLVIEVNPRHVRYYERMLGLKVIGPERMNRRVHAPAVLLSCDFSYIMEQIGEFGGQPERSESERSLFPLAFSLSEEAAIITRLQSAQRSPSDFIE